MLAALALTAILAAKPTQPPVHLLFVGNSFTYSNDMPRVVERIGRAAGRRVVTQSVAFPNYALEDHLAFGPAVSELRRGKRDFVILQQGPSAGEEGRMMLVRDSKRIAEMVKPRGSAVALLMVWPHHSRQRDFSGVATTYRMAAEAVHGPFIPAGEAWLEAWKHDADLELYSPDGLHPTTLGTYLAALTLYRTLIGELPPELATREAAQKAAGGALAATDEQLKIVFEAATAASRPASTD